MEQVIVVKLDGMAYGIDVKLVQEVVYSYVERSLPDSPNFIEGLAYIRDQLIPIVRTKRLFESPFFDLYGNKKILVLSFAKMRGAVTVGHYDTSAVGIAVDDVVGIESYTSADMKAVPSIYGTVVSHEITGFIEKNNLPIALLNIADFFLDAKGNFKYQKYINKTSDSEGYRISKSDLVAVQKATEGRFPFNKLTRKPILTYLARFASFEGSQIGKILNSHPNFFVDDIHAQKGIKDFKFFKNPADIYVISEYLEARIKDARKKIRIFVFDTAQSSTAESIALVMEAIRKGRIEYEIIRVSPGSTEEQDPVYTRSDLIAITDEMIQKYFQKVQGEEENYVLHPLYRKKIREESFDSFDASAYHGQGDLVYAPNVLVSYPERMDQILSTFSQVSELGSALVLGLFEDIEDFVKSFKKYYIKNRLVFIREQI